MTILSRKNIEHVDNELISTDKVDDAKKVMQKEIYDENRKRKVRTHSEAKLERQVERELNDISDLISHGYETDRAIFHHRN